MSPQTAGQDAAITPLPSLPVRNGVNFTGWLALYGNSVRQFSRGKRLLALSILFLLPTILALLVRYNAPEAAEVDDGDEMAKAERIAESEQVFLFYMIPQALIPLTALILASGMIRDEQEGQTLTYLLIRPIARPSIYLAKLLAAWTVATGLTAVFTTTTVAVIHWGEIDFWGEIMPIRALQIIALSALSLFVYTALFGALSLVMRWVLPFGVGYIVLFEGVFANIDFIVRRLTVLWYVRILAERWFSIHGESWGIDLNEAPSSMSALSTLAGAGVVMAIGAAWLFGSREIRVKTPEGG